ncbi:hypothetical protein HZV92_001845 [Salmonella enterica]|nr:hypothetical protein [Salmonella enterica]EFQ6618184.1 hypothetical protein [Salmonella enterica]
MAKDKFHLITKCEKALLNEFASAFRAASSSIIGGTPRGIGITKLLPLLFVILIILPPKTDEKNGLFDLAFQA